MFENHMGEKRLAKALAERPDLEAEVRWRPFQLRPGTPEGGLPWAEFTRRKFGGEDGTKAAFARVVAAGGRTASTSTSAGWRARRIPSTPIV